MDTSDPNIIFNDDGNCNHCSQYQRRRFKELPDEDEQKKILDKTVEQLRMAGKGREYDCIVGLSGGVDSSYVAYLTAKLGLRPLAVHLDNGWNTELSIKNIENIVSKLNIPLFTHVLDWEMFREIQRSFFKASVPNCEMPTDHAIMAVLFQLANKYGIKYIISGSNLASEGITVPTAWGRDYRDLKHLKAITNRFGECKLKGFPTLSFSQLMYRVFVNGIRFIPILNYVPYVKEDAISELKDELNWREYGRKHGESVFTRFFQEYYLPEKFGYDKRRLHFSVLINSGQMTREEAILNLKETMFKDRELSETLDFVRKKLMFSTSEWEEIMNAPPVDHLIYPTNYVFTIRDHPAAQFVRKMATGRGVMNSSKSTTTKK